MLTLLLGTDWTANRQEILDRISMDVRRKKGGRILMVPELISHDTERRLCQCAKDTASRYAEVLSFTRLARRVSDSVGNAAMECLDNGGRVVAMAAAARALTGRLKAYAALETKPEFLKGLIDAVDEFKRCCISSSMLMEASRMASGSFAQKLEELALLMEGYDALCARGKRDPRDQMTWCLEELEDSDFAKNHVFYIDGFPDFTRQHLDILAHLIAASPSVTVSLNCDDLSSGLMAFEKAGETAKQILDCAKKADVPYEIITVKGSGPLSTVYQKLFQGSFEKGSQREHLHCYGAESPYMEAMGAAEQVMELVRGGCRYRDISLVCTDMNTYAPLVSQVFHRFNIPLYQSGNEDILQKSVVCTVLSALDAALSGFEQRSVLTYLRSALSPLTMDECDLVENYAVIWAIKGQKWTKAWVNHPDGLSSDWKEFHIQRLEQINDARERAIDPLVTLRERFLKASRLREYVMALSDFLKTLKMETRLSQLAEEYDAAGDNREAQILNQLWEILLSALEQMNDTLGETAWEPEHFVRLLRLLLSQYDVGTIPPVLDAVQLGQVNTQRLHEQKHLILLGAQEGKLPGYSGSEGVLTDQEREALRRMDVAITGGAMDGIRAEFAEIYGVFCGARESIRVWYSGEQPSFVFRRLADMAGGLSEAPRHMGFACAKPSEAGAYLARWEEAQTASELELAEDYKAAMEKRNYSLGTVAKERIEGLYGQQLNLSASQIEQQAKCRLRYFLQYGLRAQERKEATVDPAEFGTYVHDVLENTCREIRDLGGFHQVSREQTLEIAHRYSKIYQEEHFSQLDSKRMEYLFRRNVQELDAIVKELWEELKDSLFQPQGFEVGFGTGGESLPGIVIENRAMPALLRGFVDRMDTWEHNGNTYYRIVDYKTGPKEFDYCDVFNGIGLQMLLYMFALRNSGEEHLGDHPIPVGVQYFPARVRFLSTEGRPDDEEAEKKRSKEWRREGLLLDDEEILRAMEPENSGKRLNFTVKKDGSRSGDLASREQMKLLEQYVQHTLGKLVEEIASGDVTPNPYTRGDHGACTWCPYGSICHKDEVEGRRNYKTMSAQRFWEELGKEMDHGR